MGWEQFTKAYNIASRRGSGGENIEVHCPWCGAYDKSKHLGLHLDSTKFGCWKGKAAHSGRNPSRLIQKLLNVSEEEALSISLNYFDISDYDFTQDKGRNCLLQTIQIPQLPNSFKNFSTTAEEYKKLSQPEINYQANLGIYLKNRGFDPKYLASRYNLFWDLTGDYFGRVVIPITWNRQILSWVGRAASEEQFPRYKACKESVYAPNMFLFDSDNLSGGRALVVCEGVFDAMKVTSCLISGVHGTCLFGNGISEQQVALLASWSEIYDQIFICLDKNETMAALKIQNSLNWYVPNIQIIFPGQKDFGETPIPQLTKELTRKCLKA